MRQTAVFIAMLWVSLVAIWLFSGEQFLDLMFAMPDLGPVDDLVLKAVVGLEGIRGELGLPDLFAALRDRLHSLTGLG